LSDVDVVAGGWSVGL